MKTYKGYESIYELENIGLTKAQMLSVKGGGDENPPPKGDPVPIPDPLNPRPK